MAFWVTAVFLVIAPLAHAQFLSLRACTANSTVVASRFANALNSAAFSACGTFCGNSSNAGTYLYTYFCSGLGTSSCFYTDTYGFLAPLVSSQSQDPLITASTGYVEVPCGFANAPIPGVTLGFSNPGNQNFVVNQQVVASSPSDTNFGYVYVDPVNGTMNRGSVGPNVDTTQTIAFTLSQTGTAVYSNTVNITFLFRSCALQINGPDRVNIYACCYYDDYAGLKYTISAPNGQSVPPVFWDFPGTFGMPDNPRLQYGLSLFAPDIVSNSVPLGTDNNPQPGFGPIVSTPPENDLFIQSCNLARLTQAEQQGPLSFYCTNNDFTKQTYFMLGCQQLLISATPVSSAITPFQAGSKVVTVCGVGNSLEDGGKECGNYGDVVTATAPDGTKTVTTFPYSSRFLPPGVTGGVTTRDQGPATGPTSQNCPNQ